MEMEKCYTIHRIPWDVVSQQMKGYYHACSCGTLIQTQQAGREHWQAGH